MATLHIVDEEKKGLEQFAGEINLDEVGDYAIIKGSVKIIATPDGYKILAGERIRINGRKYMGEKLLTDKAVISCRRKRYIFYDEMAAIRQETERKTRIKTASEMEHSYSSSDLKESAQVHLRRFMNSHEHSNFKGFTSAFCRYLIKFCGLDRAVFYWVRGKKWMPIFAIAPEKKYAPPMSVLKKVWQTGEPRLIQTREHPDDLSLSIIQNKIKTGFCFPLYHSELNICVAVFYGDATEEEMSEKKFLIASHLCRYISVYISKFFVKASDSAPKLKEIKLDGGKNGV